MDKSKEIVVASDYVPDAPCEVLIGEVVDEDTGWRWRYYHQPGMNEWRYEFKISEAALARATDQELKQYQKALITLERFAKGKIGG